MSEIVLPENRALVRAGQINIAEAVQDIRAKAITPESVQALGALIALGVQQQEREARQQFIEAFSRVRGRCKTINPTHANPAKDGSVRWWMANLNELQDEVEPICREEGLEIGFNSRREGPSSNICIGICIVRHIATGHTETFECGVNSANAQGGDLGALTSAKRGALIAAFGLKIRRDDNARMLGDYVGADQLLELQNRFFPLGRDERKFLGVAEVNVPANRKPALDDWKLIRQGYLKTLHDMLAKAEKEKAEKDKPKPNMNPDPTNPAMAKTALDSAAGAARPAPENLPGSQFDPVEAAAHSQPSLEDQAKKYAVELSPSKVSNFFASQNPSVIEYVKKQLKIPPTTSILKYEDQQHAVYVARLYALQQDQLVKDAKK